jgi:integrase
MKPVSVMPISVRKPESKIVAPTQKAIDDLPLNSGEWAVRGIAGLYVRCQAKVKTFRLQRRIDGHLIKSTLAATSLKAARVEAMRLWPGMKRRTPTDKLLGAAVEEFIEGKPHTIKTKELMRYDMSKYLAHWKSRPLEAIGRDRLGLRELQQRLTKTAGVATANQCMRLLSATYRWHAELHPDWVMWPNKAAAIVKLEPRDWALPPAKLREFWSAVRKLGALKRMFWEALMFTGARRGSVEALRWADLDLVAKTMFFKTAKRNKVYTVPIADVLVELLVEYRDSGDVVPSEWVFPSPVRDGAHIVDVRDDKRDVTSAHHLRHLFRTVIAQLGGSEDQAKLLMGHSGDTVSAGYITKGLVVESLRPLVNAIAQKYMDIVADAK